MRKDKKESLFKFTIQSNKRWEVESKLEVNDWQELAIFLIRWLVDTITDRIDKLELPDDKKIRLYNNWIKQIAEKSDEL